MPENEKSARGGQNQRVLDLGCGNGDNVYFLSKAGHDVVGIDLDVKEAQEKYPALNFLSMSAEKLDFSDGIFDEIYANDVLEHVENLEKVLNEVGRILKAGGRFIITVPHWRTEKILQKIDPDYWPSVGHRRLFEKGDLEKMLAAADFKILKRSQKSFFIFITLWLMFKLGKKINSQKGDFAPSFFYTILKIKNQFFDPEITFKTKAKYIPIWLITLPVAWIFNKFIPKTVKIEAIKATIE
ncbi:MAG: class I SAM-dependent methyltransferase [Patescibacteria group bacterium]